MERQDREVGLEQSPEHACGSAWPQAARLHQIDGDRRRTGPKSPQGKARVRLNAVRHGLCTTVPVLPGLERVREWETHRVGVLESLAPVGHLETVLAERVALLLWRLNRVAAYERAQLAEARTLVEDGQRPVHLLPAHQVDKVIRFEAHLSRQLYQAMHELEALQKGRRGEPTPLARVDVRGLADGS